MANLDPNKLAALRERLHQRDHELRAEIDAHRYGPEEAGPANIVGRVRDPGEDSVANHEQALNDADVARDMNELQEIAAALDRMATGEYGVCEACGGESAAQRLDSQPTARRCMRCQELYERTHAGARAPTL